MDTSAFFSGRTCAFLALFALLVAALPAFGQAPAPPAPAPPPGFLQNLQISGAVDGYATWNANSPANGTNALYNFNTSADSFDLNLAELKVVKPVEKPGDLGFTLELGYGQAIDTMQSADPTAGDTGLRNFVQLYATCKVPIGSGLTLDFGKFSTPVGAEVIETQSDWNYSRSLLFALAIPYNHTGLRASYSFTKAVSAYAMIVNGWNDVSDNNRGKSFGAGVSWTPNSQWSLAENVITGPEQANDNRHYRKVTDTVLTWSVTAKLSLMGNYDFGNDHVSGVAMRWQGAAAYLRYQFTPRFAVTPRVEWYTDPQGFTTGTAQQLREVTITPEYKVNGHMLVRLEYRADRSSTLFYELNNGTLARQQQTLTSGVVVYF